MVVPTGLDYASYLRLAELLSLQQPIAKPAVHDELLFITVHQLQELSFKLTLHELDDARDLMVDNDLVRACERLRRAVAVEQLLVTHLDLLDTMEPQEFRCFRGPLEGASGFQSVQFREIEFLSGLKEPLVVDQMDVGAEGRSQLLRRLAEPSLWDGFVATMESAELPAQTPGERAKSLALIAQQRRRHPFRDIWETAELLIAHDQAWASWRARHALLVERQLGHKPGTGGTRGVAYLRSRLTARFFPELWELRTDL